MNPLRRTISLLVAAVVVALAAACGPGSGDGGGGSQIESDQFRLSGTQRDAQFAVGSEDFTEQQVLGSITIQALEAAGATVVDRTGLGGNEEVRSALEAGEIDLSWEYTATGWLVHLSETSSITDPRRQYEAVANKTSKRTASAGCHPPPATTPTP